MGYAFMELLWVWYNFCNSLDRWSGMEYLGMVYFVPQLIVIFFPLTIGILASRLSDMEHKGNNYKMLCTVEERRQIYLVKVLTGMKYIFWMTLSQLAMIVIMGQIYHYTQLFPWDNIIYLVLAIGVVSICVFLIQLLLSMLIENQLIPLVIGLVGSFSGLFTLYVPQLRPFTIWGYYVLLAPVEFWWDENTRQFGVLDTECQWGMLIGFGVLALILYLVGGVLWKRKEV